MSEKTITGGPDGADNKSEYDVQPENSDAFDFEQTERQPPPLEQEAFQTEGTQEQTHSHVPRNLDFILDIPLEISVELGRTKMQIADILKLEQGSIIELTNPAGSSLEILINQKPIAKGEVVVVNEKYGIRLIEILSVMERIEKLK